MKRNKRAFGRPRILVLLSIGALLSCSDVVDFNFPNPSEPGEADLYDLVEGSVERPSGFDVVAGRGNGLPRAVRVDQTPSWDVAFAIQDGSPVWLPRGFFDGFEESPGILRVQRAFGEVTQAPGDRDAYETRDPVPVSAGAVYVIRSRRDEAISFPCRVFAKLEVLELETEPARVRFRYLWNPNCDRRDLRPERS